ncbi:MAG TPA: hypothetical protein VH144_03600 [Candidatus Saccharimonadales bacterium]|nr:hypothetical protein [Candidatus Saccharimonadales bacterium]
MTQLPEHGERIKEVPTLGVIDFDRTLGSTPAIMARFDAAVMRCGLDQQAVDDMRAEQHRREAVGETVSLLGFIRERGDEFVEAFKQAFIEAKDYPIGYYNHAGEDESASFLERLQAADMPYVIVTYGVDEEWQQLKLDAAGYAGPRMIVDHPRKADIINSWRQPDGTYRLELHDEVIIAEETWLIDDKAKAFDGYAGEGFWIQRGDLLPSQRGEVGNNVHILRSLDEIRFEDRRPVLNYPNTQAA